MQDKVKISSKKSVGEAKGLPDASVARELLLLRRTLIVLSIAALFLLVAVCAYFPLAERYPILHIGCATSKLLHIYCPGCGGTRAVRALLHGDLLRSLICQPVVIWLAFLAAAQYVRALLALRRRNPSLCTIPAWSWISVIVLLLVVFVARNLLMIFCGVDTLGENLPFWDAVMGR